MSVKGKFRYTTSEFEANLSSGLSNEEIIATGQRLTYNKGSAEIKIKLNENSNDFIRLEPKDILTVPQGFDRIYITAENSDETIKLIISSPGNLSIDSNQVTINSIAQVTVNKLLERDISNYYDSLDKNEFIGGGIFASGASNYPYIQLLNPTASGKFLILKSILFNPNIITGCSIAVATAELTTLINTGFNKYISESAGVGEIRGQAVTSLPTTIIASKGSNAWEEKSFLNRSSIIIPEGEGIDIFLTSTASVIYAGFEWGEITP